MAKGQRRSNREPKKPRQPQLKVGCGLFPAVPARQRRGTSTSISGPPPRGPERTELAIRHRPAG
jgi:hypothetical protein